MFNKTIIENLNKMKHRFLVCACNILRTHRYNKRCLECLCVEKKSKKKERP